MRRGARGIRFCRTLRESKKQSKDTNQIPRATAYRGRLFRDGRADRPSLNAIRGRRRGADASAAAPMPDASAGAMRVPARCEGQTRPVSDGRTAPWPLPADVSPRSRRAAQPLPALLASPPPPRVSGRSCAGHGGLGPPSPRALGPARTRARLRDPEIRPAIRPEIRIGQ